MTDVTTIKIRAVGAIRSSNNELWMRLLEIAIKHAPAEAKAVLRDINANDRAISRLLEELAQ